MEENAPKQPLAPFLAFCQDYRSKIQAEFPTLLQREVARKLGEKWESLENKQEYIERAKEERRIYAQVRAQYEAGKNKLVDVGEEQLNKKSKKTISSDVVINSEKENVIPKTSPIKENEKPVNTAPAVVLETASQSTIDVF